MKKAIRYTYQTDFKLSSEATYSLWLERCAEAYGVKSLALTFAYMSDNQLLELNTKYLNHDTYTDIITFDDSVGLDVIANIAISIERVTANARKYRQTVGKELLRVMCHGLLHCLGFEDKTDEGKNAMRLAEDRCIQLFHVEHNREQHV